jgi:hypothetical protein
MALPIVEQLVLAVKPFVGNDTWRWNILLITMTNFKPTKRERIARGARQIP